MDISKIVVIVLTLIAVGFLIWFEVNSRRNSRNAQQVADKPSPEVQEPPAKRR